MVDMNLIADLDIHDDEAESMVAAELGETVAKGDMDGLLSDQIGDFKLGTILTGKIIGKAGDGFLVEIGFKSEGVLGHHEFDDPNAVEIGDAVEVMLEDMEADGGAYLRGFARRCQPAALVRPAPGHTVIFPEQQLITSSAA